MFTICLNTTTFDLSRTPATGEIWVSTGENEFPAKHWNDFPLVVLSSWIMRADELLVGRRRRVQLRFVDGPYSMNVSRSKTSPSLLEVCCVEDRLRIHQLVVVEVPCDELESAVKEAAARVTRYCRDRNYEGDDLAELLKAVDGQRD
jgi:hypothetical protein